MRSPEQIAMQVIGEDGAIDPEVVDAIRLAVQEAVEEAIGCVVPDDFEKGSSEWCALRVVEDEIRTHFKKAGY